LRYALPPTLPQPSTAGVQPYRAQSASHTRIASGHADSAPTGSPDARLTPLITRYAMAALADGAQISDLSSRSAKYPSESAPPYWQSSSRSVSSSWAVRSGSRVPGRSSSTVATMTESNPNAPVV
jgi:hypothetical protein